MSVRRLAEEQPESFAFTAENRALAEREVSKYPPGRQYSAVIGLLWQAQLQHGGWLPEPAIRHVAEMLDMPYISVLEIATFYTMFTLAPVGRKAHIQVCGTTPCMLRGAEELKRICRERIHPEQYHLSKEGDFSWAEIECAGACVNAPMVQIDSDTFEDLTPESFSQLIDKIVAGGQMTPGPQLDRHFSEPAGGATTLTDPSLYRGGEGRKATVKEPEPQSEVASDDLKQISGVGPKLAEKLNALGIRRLEQIAAWTAEDIARVDDQLKFRGRISRDNWVGQANAMASPKRGEES